MSVTCSRRTARFGDVTFARLRRGPSVEQWRDGLVIIGENCIRRTWRRTHVTAAAKIRRKYCLKFRVPGRLALWNHCIFTNTRRANVVVMRFSYFIFSIK